MDAHSELVNRILSDLDNILRKNADIESFDVIEGPECTDNRSPIYIVENNLAIELWCVPLVYPSSCTQLQSIPQKAAVASNFLLLVNPEFQSAWNVRKKLYLQHVLSFQEEMLLTQLALSRKPKNADALLHRKWVLMQEINTLTTERRQSLLHSELSLCDTLSGKYFSNYNAWDYRRYLMHHYVEAAPLIIENELQRSKEFIQAHVSDYSGISYRQYILLRVNSKPLYAAELQSVSDLICTFQGHEALWMHRRFCISAILGLIKYTDKKNFKTVELNCKDALLGRVQDTEQKFVRDVWKLGMEWQNTLCERHIRWLSNYVKFECSVENN